MERDEFIIRNAIVHILDSTAGIPALSDTVLELGPDLNDFIRGHIYKIASGDDVKHCHFDEETSLVYPILKSFKEENLVEASKELAGLLYTIMNQNIDIPPADLLIAVYQYKSQLHLAILKLNYKETFVHLTGEAEGLNCNDIIKYKATLPSFGARLTEAALINLSSMDTLLVEKKYEINGVKTNYMSSLFLGCRTNLSSKTKLSIVTKAVEQINKTYFDDNFDKQMETKSILQNEFAEEGLLDIPKITEKIYGSQPEIKEAFTEKLEKYHIEKEAVAPQSKSTIRKLEKQFLTTDSGIEINIPMEQYNNPQNIEFITNADGTLSVLIKNINRLSTK